MTARVVLKALLMLSLAAAVADQEPSQAFAIVRPVKGRTQLLIDDQGLSFLRNLKEPVVPVVIIGPYRSGKSFLLNQLLGISCNEGFEVGHTRNTQTKGIWVWGQPKRMSWNGGPASMLFMDTEGFEATGKSDAYDDRIFALSTVMASLLIYNLPEAVRESDIQKLSFAVELADAFFSKEQVPGALQPGSMLWLIQRDFLQGKTVGEMVAAALAAQPNPDGDKDISQVNRIRQSLSLIARNSTAFGLRQPHLNRTELCAIPDESLDVHYVQQRAQLQQLVAGLAHPKAIKGSTMTGPALADLIERMVKALNQRDIPSAGSMLEYFNKDLLYSVKDNYVARLERQPLPASEATLAAWHRQAAAAALQAFDRDKFGGSSATGSAAKLRDALLTIIEKEYGTRLTANTLKSSQVCEAAEQRCEDIMEADQHMTLPSTGRFRSHFAKCTSAFERVCIGPGLNTSSLRLQKAWNREEARFRSDYNSKILTGLVVTSLVAILLFRFVIRISIVEMAGWAAFIFLQVYPKLYVSGGSMYDARWWGLLVRAWEAAVWSGFDLQRWGPKVLPVALVIWLVIKAISRYRGGSWSSRHQGRRKVVSTGNPYLHGNVRDLDV